MGGSVSDAFAWIKAGLARRGRGYGELANAHLHTDHLSKMFRSRISYLDLQGHQQIELFLRLIIAEFGIPDPGLLSDEGRVLLIALVGVTDASGEGTNTDPTLTLKGVIPFIGVLNRWATGLRRLVQPFKAFFFVILARRRSTFFLLSFVLKPLQVAATCRSTLQASCEGRWQRVRNPVDIPLGNRVTLLVLPCSKA